MLLKAMYSLRIIRVSGILIALPNYIHTFYPFNERISYHFSINMEIKQKKSRIDSFMIQMKLCIRIEIDKFLFFFLFFRFYNHKKLFSLSIKYIVIYIFFVVIVNGVIIGCCSKFAFYVELGKNIINWQTFKILRFDCEYYESGLF